jgi:hypothetical protein
MRVDPSDNSRSHQEQRNGGQGRAAAEESVAIAGQGFAKKSDLLR